MKKAVVFDNSGTLIERYRVIKDVLNGNLFTDINSLELIDAADALALVVLQFNTNKLLKLDQNTLISDVIKEYGIDFDISFSTNSVSKAEVKQIIDNDSIIVPSYTILDGEYNEGDYIIQNEMDNLIDGLITLFGTGTINNIDLNISLDSSKIDAIYNSNILNATISKKILYTYGGQ